MVVSICVQSSWLSYGTRNPTLQLLVTSGRITYPSFPHTVKPHINREKLKKIVTRASQKVFLEVDVKGEPPPDIWWTLKNKKVRRDGYQS